MYASVQRQSGFDFSLLRWSARASAAVLVVIWIALVLVEVVSLRFEAPAPVIFQGMALAVVFAGYAIGWRQELVGGVVVILGTIAFFVVNLVTIGVLPAAEAAWFAAPGVLYLLAWYSEKASPTRVRQL